MTQSIIIFILIAVFQAVAGYYAKKAKEKQAAAEAAGRGEGSRVGVTPSLDGTRPVQVNSVRPMTAQQAIAVARLIEQRNVIEAVMALRAICNIGLAEARDVINQFPARGFPAELLPAGGVSTTGTGCSVPPHARAAYKAMASRKFATGPAATIIGRCARGWREKARGRSVSGIGSAASRSRSSSIWT